MTRASSLHPSRSLVALLALVVVTGHGGAVAQALTPAFTYQGELRLASGPASGSFDMQFRLYNAPAGGSQIGDTLTAGNLSVVEGLFSVPLDFGPAQFAGDRQWLEIAIRQAGMGGYETLSPRTEVTAAPYAWGAAVALANSVTTTSIVDGSVGAADINATQVQRRVSGTCPVGQAVRAIAQDGGVTCGTLAAETSGWALGGNAGTDPTSDFLGTTDSHPLELRAANARGLRIEPSSVAFGSPALPVTSNTIAGSHANAVIDGVRGATIAGGGVPIGDSDPDLADEAPNRVTDHYGAVGGGYGNRVGDDDGNPSNHAFATVGGGQLNTAGARGSTVGGGLRNLAGGVLSTVSGGQDNVASGTTSTVGGGSENLSSHPSSTVCGGIRNTASGLASAVCGGNQNVAGALSATVAGGEQNVASAPSSAIGGGVRNRASGGLGVVAGGSENLASSQSAVGGGSGNAAVGVWSSISGGLNNCAGGNSSWAGGTRAKIRPASIPENASGCAGVATLPGGPGDAGTFVWADFQSSDFVSTGSNQFLVRADGGFGFNTNSIPAGIEAVLQGRTGPNPNVDLYLKPAAHGRGINLAMLPGTGAAAFYVSQYDGSSFVDRILLAPNGDFSVTAQAFKPGGGSWAVPSDARLKTDISTLTGALDRLLALRGVEYAYRPEATPKSMYLPGRQLGFIAQEVERVFPDWVSETDDGYRIVGPRGFEALTVEALRELRGESAVIDDAQDARIAALEASNQALRAELAALRTLLRAGAAGP